MAWNLKHKNTGKIILRNKLRNDIITYRQCPLEMSQIAYIPTIDHSTPKFINTESGSVKL